MRLRKTTRVVAYGLLVTITMIVLGVGGAYTSNVTLAGEGYAGILLLATICGVLAVTYIATAPEDDK